MPRRAAFDRWLLFAATLLAIGGLFVVGSASNYFAMDRAHDASAYFWRHLGHLVLGFLLLFGAAHLDYRRLADGRLMVLLVGFSLFLLLFVLAMPASGGAHRWFHLGPFRFQPSEVAKLVTVLCVAHVLARKEDRINDFWAVPFPCGVLVGTLSLLVVIEPDLGSAVMMVLVACVMLFVAGLSWRWVGAAGVAGAAAFATAVVAEPYRLERIRGFLDPTHDLQGQNFQLQQSLIALGHGGLLGTGFGQGQQKAFYLPAAHTDFIYSVIGEEFGLLGTGLLLGAFLIVYWRGMRAAARAPDRFGFYLALGVTHLIVLQALINMGVCLGLLPTKGLPLPFLSYGGSSLLMTMTASGLLLNVSQHSN